MALTPLDIKNKQFEKKMRGYDADEVDDFLDMVISDYEDTLKEKRDLEKALKHAEEKLTYFNELKDALNQSIIVAQDTADKLKDSAERESDIVVTSANADAKGILARATSEAEATVTEANRKAAEILNSATTIATQLATETDDLKKKTREFHRNLALILEQQLDIVKSDEWDDLLRPFSSYVGDDHEAVKDLLDGELDRDEDYKLESEGNTQAIELSELKSAVENTEEKKEDTLPEAVEKEEENVK